MTGPESASQATAPSPLVRLAIEFGPLVTFFVTQRATRDSDPAGLDGLYYATIAFMVAAVVALVFSKLKFGHVSPMLILSTTLIVGFGGLTIWLQDEKFIQIKPTAIYLLFGALLIGGWLRGKALLQILLGAAFEGVDHQGWLKQRK